MQAMGKATDAISVSLQPDDAVLQPPKPLPWYPDNLAWHFDFSKSQLRKMPVLEAIHELLKRENDAGTITRQEAVSMIPPLFMDIQSHHKVIRGCHRFLEVDVAQ